MAGNSWSLIRRKRKAESGNYFFVWVVYSTEPRLIAMSTNLEYRERERQRLKRESGRQASEAQREKERQRARARDKKQRRRISLEEQHEYFEVAFSLPSPFSITVNSR